MTGPDGAGEVRIGVNVPTFGAPVSELGLDWMAAEVEASGLDGVWLSDHVVLFDDYDSVYLYSTDGRYTISADQPWYELLVSMGFVAAVTERVTIGTSVCIVPQRQPVLLAKQLATVDQLSGGRVIMGAGIGWLAEEYEALGVPFGARGARMDACLALLRACWTGAPAAGAYGPYTIPDGVRCLPTPVTRRIPVRIGGNSDPALRRVVRHGDAWYGAVPDTGMSVEEVAAIRDRLRRLCAEEGRHPGEVGMSLRLALSGRDLAQEACVERLQGYVDAGVTDLTVDFAWKSQQDARSRLAALATIRNALRPATTGNTPDPEKPGTAT